MTGFTPDVTRATREWATVTHAGNSDHAVMVVNMRCYIERNSSRTLTRKKYHLANYDNMKEDLLKINWKDECKSKNTEETADMLLEHTYNTEK